MYFKRNGLKICNQTASEIRDKVKEYVEGGNVVPSKEADLLHRIAQNDDRYHALEDPYFSEGGGPAVKREQESSH